MKPSFIILGAGGHAKVLINALLASSTAIAGIVDPNPSLEGTTVLGVPVLGSDDIISPKYASPELKLVNALGSIGLPLPRQMLYEKFKLMGYLFATVMHPSAIVAPDVILGEGVQVMAGAVLQPGSHIGCNVIINTKSSVDHDCTIGDHVHISPGVTLSGGVDVGAGSHLGTGATVIQGIRIGSNCLIAAGSVVTKDIMSGSKVRGVPAREFV